MTSSLIECIRYRQPVMVKSVIKDVHELLVQRGYKQVPVITSWKIIRSCFDIQRESTSGVRGTWEGNGFNAFFYIEHTGIEGWTL